MARLAVLSVYDPDGMIDDYIVYYIDSLKTVADRIVVVVNGRLGAEGEHKLRKAADDIYMRSNTGFDFGAYKDVLLNRMPDRIWDDYRELILCNDTCFGPFVPFEKIFNSMDKRKLEFWSIHYMDNELLPHYQSYFMVFSGKALGLIKAFLEKVVDEKIVDIAYVQGYEHSLSESMMQQKSISAGYYTSGQEDYPNLDIYRSPDYAIRYLGLPFLKKKCFLPRLSTEKNCYAALDYIRQKTEYPIQHIYHSIKRCYGADIKMRFADLLPQTNPHSFWTFYISREDIILFCKNYKKIYLFGKGYLSVFVLARFRRYMNAFGGFIVSDGHYTGELETDKMVYPLSAVSKDAPIIVALLEKNSREVYELLKEWENAVFLTVPADLQETVWAGRNNR